MRPTGAIFAQRNLRNSSTDYIMGLNSEFKFAYNVNFTRTLIADTLRSYTCMQLFYHAEVNKNITSVQKPLTLLIYERCVHYALLMKFVGS
jgi:hypothetical protein